MAKIDENILAQFYGSEEFYKSGTSAILLTEGVHYLTENGANWFVADTLLNILSLKQLKGEDFLHIKVVRNGEGADYTIDDGNDNILHKDNIPFTDLNVPELRMYFVSNILMLPNEY